MKITVHLFLGFLCLATVGPKAKAVIPAPDGGYPGGNTAEGQNALLSRTTGSYNTAVGYLSLLSDTSNGFNTAIGAGTLLANTADNNTAIGAGALLSNTTSGGNTATGAFALFSNTDAGLNTAMGCYALQRNTGGANTAVGYGALPFNSTGFNNTAVGDEALAISETGNNNTAIGVAAGFTVTTASHVICIGHGGANVDYSTWIANVYGTTTQNGITAPVIVSADGQLGTVSSSERFKKDIATMENASKGILALRPVTFHYKSDKENTPQFGLVAEEVAKVNPALVLPDKEGKPYTVRYDAVNAMLLNEFLKARRQIDAQQKQIDTLTVGLQKITAQLATANGAAGVRSDIDGSSREADTSGSELVNPPLADSNSAKLHRKLF
jgi:trimeric autotransporter adhesin